MQSLPKALQDNVQVYQDMYSDIIPQGRWNPADHVSDMRMKDF